MNNRKILKPFIFKTDLKNNIIQDSDSHIIRRLSSMDGQYADKDKYNEMVKKEDEVLYEVYEKKVPEKEGELMQGLTVLHPGKVGNEYFMTKGHFHLILDTAELYYCFKGHGYMMMETKDGQWDAKELYSNTAVYVPGGWAHRSINVGKEDLVMLFVYPATAGHDYDTIETKGFRKLMVEENSKPKVMDNPKWKI